MLGLSDGAEIASALGGDVNFHGRVDDGKVAIDAVFKFNLLLSNVEILLLRTYSSHQAGETWIGNQRCLVHLHLFAVFSLGERTFLGPPRKLGVVTKLL